MNLGTCRFEGFATKMKLVSHNRIEGKPTRAIEETEQHFTLTRDGRIWFSGYRDENNKQEKLRQFQEKISPEAANYFLACIGYELSQAEVDWPGPNESYWDLELTNEKDDTYRYRGLMPTTDKALHDMSDWLRNVLGTDTILAFDGEARFAITVRPEEKIFVAVKSIIDPDEEPYWYFYEGNNINIGDQFLAPFRKGERYYNVEVVDIVVATPENGPVPLRQQKRMMVLEGSMRSKLPGEFTNMFKKMNGWDVN
ncbi:hypothetical protein [Butyrivibrio sp. AE3004]|uniref:hypothetical protein n=1 Tax=Butyrivibrio sp. AE3004 TaxID=1506994 RepID=UPI000494A009|nr:hypothetical protein [Butyrivibrio sp. AE3004]